LAAGFLHDVVMPIGDKAAATSFIDICGMAMGFVTVLI
jgi:hypothetical protein